MTAKGPLIAIVLNKRIFLGDIRLDESDRGKLRDYHAIAPLIVGPLSTKYVKDHRLTASKDEIREFRNWMLALRDSDGQLLIKEATADDVRDLDDIARISVGEWKFNRALYKEYGGRVEFQQNGTEPVEAYHNWLLAQEKSGAFVICDRRWRDALWEYYEPKYHPQLRTENDPFRIPPWGAGQAGRRGK